MKILLLTRMMEVLQQTTLEKRNLMQVILVMRKRDQQRKRRKMLQCRNLQLQARKREEEGIKKRKQKKKKDPNAPKRALSGFMFFSQTEWENTKKENPGISFLDIGKALGEKWRNMSAEEKEPYEAKARADKKRYKDEIGGYKNPQTVDAGAAGGSD